MSIEHQSKHALNSTSKDSTTLKGMKRTTNHTSGAERKSVKLFNNALDSLITQSKDCSSDSELEDNIIKNSASNRLSIDKKYNGTVYNKKSRKKDLKNLYLKMTSYLVFMIAKVTKEIRLMVQDRLIALVINC